MLGSGGSGPRANVLPPGDQPAAPSPTCVLLCSWALELPKLGSVTWK